MTHAGDRARARRLLLPDDAPFRRHGNARRFDSAGGSSPTRDTDA
jgi:hypothetical protein